MGRFFAAVAIEAAIAAARRHIFLGGLVHETNQIPHSVPEPLLYKMEKPWDFWRVAVTLLPGKLLGSVLWQSYWLVLLGHSKRAMGPLMVYRAAEAGLELVLDTLIIFLLFRTGIFRRMGLWRPKTKQK